MSINKLERQMNLIICLLNVKRPVSSEYIYENVAGYKDSKNIIAFNRMFERDKAELRSLGVPIQLNKDLDDENRDVYSIQREAYELPKIDFNASEMIAITAATNLWKSIGSNSGSWIKKNSYSDVQDNFMIEKLSSAGLDISKFEQAIPVPQVAFDLLENDIDLLPGAIENLVALLNAIDKRISIAFSYQKNTSDNSESETRSVSPWFIKTHRSNWYLFGFDHQRQAERTFKLRNIISKISDSKTKYVPSPQNISLDDYRFSLSSEIQYSQVKLSVTKEYSGWLTVICDESFEDNDNNHRKILAFKSIPQSDLIKAILGSSDSIRVIKPEQLKNDLQERLLKLRNCLDNDG